MARNRPGDQNQEVAGVDLGPGDDDTQRCHELSCGACRARHWRAASLFMDRRRVAAVIAVPLIVGLVVMRTPRWYPVLDWAWIELRVRDVGTHHSPLVGLPGRLSALGVTGSHPGPISFYALAPIYRLLGSSSWALLASTAALNLAAAATAVWIAVRRGWWSLARVSPHLGVLVHACTGVDRLAVPWNPWLPMLGGSCSCWRRGRWCPATSRCCRSWCGRQFLRGDARLLPRDGRRRRYRNGRVACHPDTTRAA